jgi:hypothetical protein
MRAATPLLLLLAGCTIDTGLEGTDEPNRGGGGEDPAIRDSGGTGVGGDDTGPVGGGDGVGGDGGGGTGGGSGGDGDRVRTAGMELWLAYMENLTLAFNGPPAFRVVVEAPEGAEGSIDVPATGYTQPFSLAPGAIEEIALPDAIWYAEGSDVAGVAGVRVRADRPVEAVGVHYRVYFSEAARLLPLEELGTDHRVLAVPDLSGQSPSSFVVVATADGTELEVTPSVFTFGLRPADVPYTVALDAGEIWQVQADGDLSGSRVRSLGGQPIAVFAGAREAVAGCGLGANSHVWDQVLPLDRWGRHTEVLPLARKSEDVVRVLAHEDGTEVRLDCGAPVTLDAGEVLERRVSGGVSVTATAPVLVGQVVASGDCDRDGADPDGGLSGVGDPNLIILPPAPLTRPDARFRGLRGVSTLEPATHHVSLRGAGLAVDGAAVDGPAVDVAAGDHAASAEDGLQGVAYGLAPYEAYSYHLGYDCTGCLPALQEAPACD